MATRKQNATVVTMVQAGGARRVSGCPKGMALGCQGDGLPERGNGQPWQQVGFLFLHQKLTAESLLDFTRLTNPATMGEKKGMHSSMRLEKV